MDILNPQLLWIGKRCYRVNPSNDNSVEPQQQTTSEYIENGQCSEFAGNLSIRRTLIQYVSIIITFKTQ